MIISRLVSVAVSFGLVVGFVVPMDAVVAAVLPESATSAAASVVPNELGRIPILEYHQVGPKEERWTRSFENFRMDLEWLYNNDYRAVSIDDFAQQRISLPYGKKPVIFTFDDGGYTQLNFKDGRVDPYTAVGVMDEFLKKRPDFGASAVFYVNNAPFKLVNDKKKAIEYLLSSGRQIGNHTMTHANLAKLNASGVEKELSRLDNYVRGLGFQDVDLSTLAYPFGGVPRGDSARVMKKYAELGLLVGADPANVPYHVNYDPYFVPRIQAIDSEWKRWFKRGAKDTARSAAVLPFAPFVSDGNADVITVLSEAGLKRASVRKGVNVVVSGGGVANALSFTKKATTAVRASVEDDETLQISLEMKKEKYPYEDCNDSDAAKFIEYKKSGILGEQKTSFFNWSGIVSLPKTFLHFVRTNSRPEVVRGIYFTGSTATSDAGKRLVEKLLASGGNTLVVDINESDGALTYGKLDQKPILRDLRANIAEWKSKGIYVVARVVAFKERVVSRARSDLAIKNAGGGAWRDNRGSVWLDPSNPQTVQYAIDMAKEAAIMGVDEVQFDYVRFPTEGNLGAARFMFDPKKKQKWEVIRDFLKEARTQLIPLGVSLSADIFGIVGWQPAPNYRTTGQRIECVAPYLDVIYPMGYPSHFGPGFGGHANPADEPYYFTWKTSQYFVDYAKGTGVAIRPWLQSFTYRVTIPYNSSYISEQMRGAFAAGSQGFVLWNAGNAYDIGWSVIGK